MGLLKLLIKDPLAFVIIAVLLLYSIVIHEVAHGWVAYKMGDPTAKWSGRLSLNPIKHLDLIGTLMLFLAGFGWAKPVPVNLNNIPDRRKGIVLVSSAGIIANILLAVSALMFFRLFSTSYSGLFAGVIYYVVQINVTLAVLNLIPIPPLDGSKILMGIASVRIQNLLSPLEPYGFFIIIVLLSLGIMDPLIALIRGIIVTLIGILLP